MADTEKQKAMERVKKMFDTFDVDNEQHSAIVIMYDKEAGDFKMLTVNATPMTAALLLTNAYESVLESVKDMMDSERTLN